MWRVRRATVDDHDPIVRLWEESGLGATAEDEWDALITGPTSMVFVAESEGRLAGTAVATFDGWRAYVYHVAVEPACRGMGLGRVLMEHAERRLAVAGARRVYLMINESNTAGLALAASEGYLPEGDVAFVKEIESGAPRVRTPAALSA